MRQSYNGFGYELISEGLWWLILPSKLKSKIEAADEDEVKAKIDAMIEAAGG